MGVPSLPSGKCAERSGAGLSGALAELPELAELDPVPSRAALLHAVRHRALAERSGTVNVHCTRATFKFIVNGSNGLQLSFELLQIMLDTDIETLYLEFNNGLQRPQRHGVSTMRQDLIEALYREFGRQRDIARSIALSYLIKDLQSHKRGSCGNAKVYLRMLRRERKVKSVYRADLPVTID